MVRLARPSLSDAVAERLRAEIVEGRWQLGGRLPTEPELTAELGVSRSTLREAVRALCHAGILVTRQGDGTYVAGLPTRDEPLAARLRRANMVDLLDVREALEIQAARLAAQRRTPDDVVVLRALLDQRAAARHDRALEAFVDADLRFHERIIAAAGNTMLAELHEVFRIAIRAALLETDGQAIWDGPDTHADHVAIFDGIEAREPERAALAAERLTGATRELWRHKLGAPS